MEWEEEDPEGESLRGSDDEKEKDQEDDDYEVDNEFFVPHGHLSDEEMEHEDEIPEDNTPEAQKAKLKIMQQEFAAEMKKKTEKIKPRLIGCVWVKNNASASNACSPIVWEMLQARAMLVEGVVTLNLNDPADEAERAVASGPKKTRITEEGMRDLIRLVHGNTHSRKFLVDEFAAYRTKQYGDKEGFCEFFNVGSKIKEIADYRQGAETEPTLHNNNAWFVRDDVLDQYNMKDLARLPNAWEYVLAPTRKLTGSPKSTPNRKVVTEEAMPDLIRLVHGNTHQRKLLVDEFRAFRKAAYGSQEDFKEFQLVGKCIKRIAEWKRCEDDGPFKGKYAWLVQPEVLQKYNLTELPLPNKWQYHIELPTKKLRPTKLDVEAVKENIAEPKAPVSIEKFAVVLSVEEKRKQFEKLAESKPVVDNIQSPASTVVTSNNVSVKPVAAGSQKKRVQLLMSVPRGQAIPEAAKNSLIQNFLNKNTGIKNASKTSSSQVAGPQTSATPAGLPMEVDDDVIVLD